MVRRHSTDVFGLGAYNVPVVGAREQRRRQRPSDAAFVGAAASASRLLLSSAEPLFLLILADSWM